MAKNVNCPLSQTKFRIPHRELMKEGTTIDRERRREEGGRQIDILLYIYGSEPLTP
jgi:hypothetical protein